jgi:hypothetical protein
MRLEIWGAGAAAAVVGVCGSGCLFIGGAVGRVRLVGMQVAVAEDRRTAAERTRLERRGDTEREREVVMMGSRPLGTMD